MSQSNGMGQGRHLPDGVTQVATIGRNQMTRAMKLNCQRPRRRGILIGKRNRIVGGDLQRLLT